MAESSGILPFFSCGSKILNMFCYSLSLDGSKQIFSCTWSRCWLFVTGVGTVTKAQACTSLPKNGIFKGLQTWKGTDIISR